MYSLTICFTWSLSINSISNNIIFHFSTGIIVASDFIPHDLLHRVARFIALAMFWDILKIAQGGFILLNVLLNELSEEAVGIINQLYLEYFAVSFQITVSYCGSNTFLRSNFLPFLPARTAYTASICFSSSIENIRSKTALNCLDVTVLVTFTDVVL